MHIPPKETADSGRKVTGGSGRMVTTDSGHGDQWIRSEATEFFYRNSDSRLSSFALSPFFFLSEGPSMSIL